MTATVKVRKKLIEVALPLEAINKAAAREKSIRHGHPSTLHLWWARRPLAAARAVIFSQMVDDPSAYVDELKDVPGLRRKAESVLRSRHKRWEEATAIAQKAKAAGIAAPEPGPEPKLDDILAEAARNDLFKIIEDLVLWENTTNEEVLQKARDAIWESWRRTCRDNAGHPRAKELFDRHKLPAFHDPFAGGGAIPLEAQRLGLEAYASDLNPVAVLINKAMIEIPPKFAGRPPVNPGSAGIRAGELKVQDAKDGGTPGWRSRGNLPHFDKPGLIQSITFRLHDSLPQELIEEWKQELGIVEARHAGRDAGAPREVELRKRIAKYEDAGHGECWLRDKRIASLVENALLHFDQQRYHLVAWCIMPNHVHTLIQTVAGHPLDKIVHTWKSFTASAANKLLARGGAFWFREYHDRFIRDADHLAKAVTYIEQNPVKAGLVKAAVDWKFGSAAKKSGNTPAGMLALPGMWRGAQGLAEDVRYYGQWMRDEAERRIGHLYPKIEITAAMAQERPDLKPLVGRKLTVIAWLWARTVKSPNPAFGNVDVPLASTFMLARKPGKEAWVEPVIEDGGYRFVVRKGKPKNVEAINAGTKLSRGAFRCIMSGSPFQYSYIDNEANAGRMGARLMAIVAEGDRERVYLSPTDEQEKVARSATPGWVPDVPCRGTWASNAQGRRYGFATFGDYFTPRQLVTVTSFADLLQEVVKEIQRDVTAAGLDAESRSSSAFDGHHLEYGPAVTVYLAFTLDRLLQQFSTLSVWSNNPVHELVITAFGRQGLQMSWDYGEINPFCGAASWEKVLFFLSKAVDFLCENSSVERGGVAIQADARTHELSPAKIISTDPPYYDNINYADLSEFFYVWLRRSLHPFFPNLFATVTVPKAEELIAASHRHGGKEKAEAFFLEGMSRAIARVAEQTHPAFPVTLYYAFKQAETQSDSGVASTGWETFLEGVGRAGFAVTGTWPVRTERAGGFRNAEQNALASSIVLVCRSRAADAPTVTRREFVAALQRELPEALRHLQAGNIAPVDLAQAAIGPGMAVFTRYAKVVDAQDKPLRVRDALLAINQVLDTALAEQEGDFDADTRWALAWFEQFGFGEGEFGVAETLSKAKNTSVSGIVEAGIVRSKAGKVRLLRPNELSSEWDPLTDSRLTNWEMVHHLVRALESDGEGVAAEVAAKLGTKAETARELCYRLYTLCERKKRATEALSYNGLVQSWPEIMRLAKEQAVAVGEPVQQELV